MRFFKQLGMVAAARSASGSVNARWMPGLLPSIPTGFGSGSGPGSVVGIGGYHTETETRYSVMKKVLEANLKGGVVHECSYDPLKSGINVVPCFEIPKTEKFEIPETEKDVLQGLDAYSSALDALLSYEGPLKLFETVAGENLVRLNKKGAVLHAYQLSWSEGVKLTPILNLSGRADIDFKYNLFPPTMKITPVYHE